MEQQLKTSGEREERTLKKHRMEMKDKEGGFPDDIIEKILSYVPPKPLTRFKIVSKSLLNLINDPTFQLVHFKHYSSISDYLSLAAVISNRGEEEEDEDEEDEDDDDGNALLTLQLPASESSGITCISKSRIPLPFPSSSAPFHIIASCNGLLCISSSTDSLHLFNPISSSFHSIPLLPSPPHHPRWIHFGFGFDHINRDYKIVRVVQLHHFSQDHPREVHVFSLLTNSWTQVDDFPHFLSHPISNAKFLHNSLHWIVTATHPLVFDMTGLLWRGSLDDYVYDYFLLAFDLHFHTFTLLPLPDYHLGKDLVVPRLCVGVFGESLFLQVEHGPKFDRCVDIWVMNEYGVKSSWTKLLSFPYMEVRLELLPIKTLALSNQGHQVLMQQGKDCFWVQLGSGKVTDVIIEGGLPFVLALIGGHKCGFGAEVFVDSLFCFTSGVQVEGIKQAGDADGKDDRLEAGQVKRKVKVQKKRGGDLLSSRFKLI